VLRRPVIMPLPTFMVKAVFGQMGKEVVLSSLRVVLARMLAGSEFQNKTHEEAVRQELASSSRTR
jgi:uncharacterized protein